MPPINKEHAKKIVKKLGAVLDTSPKAHDLACVYHAGQLIAAFGVRRGSRKSLGHGHIPADLHLSPRETLDLANCPMSYDEWIEKLTEQGWISAPPPPQQQELEANHESH